MTLPIIDLHCDLLSYLEADPKRSPYDAAPRCSLLQLRDGNVKAQILAVFTRTGPDSVRKGMKQVEIYRDLLLFHPTELKDYCGSLPKETPFTAVALAIENASGFCGEEEPLQKGLERFRLIVREFAKPVYLSFTWNDENRFGGGVLSKAGLKEDGKRLLDELHQQRIALDLSHTSDALADDQINYIEGNHLDIPLIASHSNARAISLELRNLPDEIAKEIFRREGIIGLNFYGKFVGKSEDFFIRHIAHWLELGGENSIALGADFFFDSPYSSLGKNQGYFQNYQDSSCYGRFLDFIQKELGLKMPLLEKLAFRNAENFYTKFLR